MRLKNVLRLAFIALTLIPISIVSVLFYKSGFELSRETYSNNLNESINVQGDYISQTIESDMIYNSRFAKKTLAVYQRDKNKNSINESFNTFLDSSEDKIATCMMLDENNELLYGTGEEKVVDQIISQIPNQSTKDTQEVREFTTSKDSYSLGILTPVWINGVYQGTMVSVYNESFVFKIISNYYDISDTETYICRNNGESVRYNGYSQLEGTQIIKPEHNAKNNSSGEIDAKVNNENAFGYYKSIRNTPWYLVILVNDSLIYSFTNQFIFVYIIIIALILISDIALAFYFTNKVVRPIRSLINVMEEYQNNLDQNIVDNETNVGYYETRYLRSKFFGLMNTISLVQHNFKGIYQLYQSNDMGDINIDIDVKEQKIHSNKDSFTELLSQIELHEGDCVVENFVKCFCKKDEDKLRFIFENMRDEHLATSAEIEVFTPNLDEHWFHVVVVPLYEDDRLSRLFIQLRDISSFKRQEIESNIQARRDSLTGLYNRLGLLDFIHNDVEAKKHNAYGILFADMDYFKLVNDCFGHSEGDKLLVRIADDLSNIIKEQGIVSRLGGDEFVILLTDPKDIQRIQDEITKALIYDYVYQNKKFTISVSVGKATWDCNSSSTFEEILKQADTSMYETKRRLKI